MNIDVMNQSTYGVLPGLKLHYESFGDAVLPSISMPLFVFCFAYMVQGK